MAWDDSLDDETRLEWKKWKEELEHLNQIRINCSFLVDLDFGLVSIQLHGYSDASPNAYGAITYFHLQVETYGYKFCLQKRE